MAGCKNIYGNLVDLFWNGAIIFLPGGFSYGDYIYVQGDLAKFSPVMQAVKEFIDKHVL